MMNIIKIGITLILLLEMRFFYLFKLPNQIEKYNTYHNKQIILFIIVILVLIVILIKIKCKFRKGLFYNSFILFCIFYILQACISLLRYNQGMKGIIGSSYHLLLILLYFVLMNYIINEKSYKYVLNIIIIFSLITSTLFVIQALVYNYGGGLFLNIYEINVTSKIPLRDGMIRLTHPSTLISFSIVLSSFQMFKSRGGEKLVCTLNTIIGVIYIYYVCQTRALLIAVLIPVVIGIVSKPQKRKEVKFIYILLIIIFGIFILSSSITNEFLSSFSDPAEAGSIYARQYGINHYMNQFNKNPILGMGFIQDIINTPEFYIVHGEQGYLTTTDIGIIGFLSNYGLLGIVWLSTVLVALFNVIFSIYKQGKLREYINLVGILLYVILTLPTLVITDSQRIILLPIIMAIFEYENRYFKEKKALNKEKYV